MTDIQAALRQRARELLESGEVLYIIGWENTRSRNRTRPAFIRSAGDADRLVWNRYCVNSTAKYLLDDRWPKGRIGICARGCDSRAINRLLVDGQISREDLYIIGLPCDGKENPACERCTHKNPLVYDELIGPEVPENHGADRFARVREAEKLSLSQRRELWEAEFSKCIRCYACRNACPACNCRECFADQYRTGWQGKQMNAVENRVFGLTRAFHVGDRCIECGECERVCPMGLPLMLQTGKLLMECQDEYGSGEFGLSQDEVPVLGAYDLGDADRFN